MRKAFAILLICLPLPIVVHLLSRIITVDGMKSLSKSSDQKSYIWPHSDTNSASSKVSWQLVGVKEDMRIFSWNWFMKDWDDHGRSNP
jgi:hypothetical protein